MRQVLKACCGAALAVATLLAPQGAAVAGDPHTWIVGATVISPDRANDGQKLNVLIDGDRIAAVVQTLPPGAMQDALIVDAAGMFLVPGLIDSHVHLNGVPGLIPPMQVDYPNLVRDYRTQMPRSFLRYGYTTVIDLIPTDLRVLEAFVAAPAHPDLYHCGALPVANGYPTQFAPSLLRSRIFPNFVVDPKSGDVAPSGSDAQAHTPEAAVGRVKQEGGICVKTFFERGFGRDHDLPVPSSELFARIVKSARIAGLPVLLHATSLEAQRFGVEGGADIFAHGMWNWNEFNSSVTLPDPAREVLDQIASRHTGYMPTLQVIGGLRLLFEPDYFDRPAVRRVVPQSLLDWYRSPAGHWYKDDLSGGATDEQMRTRYDATLSRGAQSTGYLAKKGAIFLFGTDTPSGPTPGNLPGLNGYLEMQRLVAANVSLRQIFEAATLNNAKVFGLANQIGTIETGKRANLLLLSRSPLESVEAYDTIRSVWIGGRRLEPESLEAGK